MRNHNVARLKWTLKTKKLEGTAVFPMFYDDRTWRQIALTRENRKLYAVEAKTKDLIVSAANIENQFNGWHTWSAEIALAWKRKSTCFGATCRAISRTKRMKGARGISNSVDLCSFLICCSALWPENESWMPHLLRRRHRFKTRLRRVLYTGIVFEPIKQWSPDANNGQKLDVTCHPCAPTPDIFRSWLFGVGKTRWACPRPKKKLEKVHFKNRAVPVQDERSVAVDCFPTLWTTADPFSKILMAASGRKGTVFLQSRLVNLLKAMDAFRKATRPQNLAPNTSSPTHHKRWVKYSIKNIESHITAVFLRTVLMQVFISILPSITSKDVPSICVLRNYAKIAVHCKEFLEKLRLNVKKRKSNQVWNVAFWSSHLFSLTPLNVITASPRASSISMVTVPIFLLFA